MTPTDRLALFERLFHRLTFAREVKMDADEVRLLLDGIGRWSNAHRDGNGALSDKDVQQQINQALAHLEHLLHPPSSGHERLARHALLAQPDPLSHPQSATPSRHPG
jgi:hypothetical protein